MEREIRKEAKRKFIQLRNIKEGIRAYLPNGIDTVTFSSWEETREFIFNYGG